MRIGMYDVDSKLPNLALMKLTRYHLNRGDEVRSFDGANPEHHAAFDKVYASKVFTFSPAPYLHSSMVIGGTGWGMDMVLADSAETLAPSYRLYPDFRGNIGFTMRGCRLACDFCVVPDKEGLPYSTNSVSDLLINDSDFLILLDNDPFGNPQWRDVCAEITDRKIKVNFSQGFNIRNLKPEQAAALAGVDFRNTKNTRKQATFAWDNVRDEKAVMRGLDMLKDAGIKPYRLQCFVLIGYDSAPDEDLYRVNTLLDQGVDPFAMPYNKADPYQKAFTRWVNGRLCRSTPWPEYKTGVWNK